MPLMSPTLPHLPHLLTESLSSEKESSFELKENSKETKEELKEETTTRIGSVITPKTAEILSPNFNSNFNSTKPNALDVLRAAGVDSRRGKSRMSPLLSDSGLGLEECARKLTNFASYSEDENIQFQSVKLALQLHGELEKDGVKETGVQINFVGVTPDLLQVLIPRS